MRTLYSPINLDLNRRGSRWGHKPLHLPKLAQILWFMSFFVHSHLLPWHHLQESCDMIGARYIEKNTWARVDMEFLFKCLTGPSGYQPCLTLNAARCVYNTLIEPILCYTDTTWGELSVTFSKTLQQLQNRAAHIDWRDSSKDTLSVLGWLR